jgi:DNA-binding beta-propeller fold protein YncE
MDRRDRMIVVVLSLFLLFGGLSIGQAAIQRAADARAAPAPRFEVDPFWPRPLPNDWRLGSVVGVAVDHDDNVWIVHRSSATLSVEERGAEFDPPHGECCSGAPPILAFDPAGNLIHAWGGSPGEEYQGYTWPESNHGIFIDHLGFVWLGGNGQGDSHVLKLTRTGDVVAQFGEVGARASGGQTAYTRDSLDPVSFGRVAKVFVDPSTDEAYVADGYFNRRVAVLDAVSGEILRFWGAYGNLPDDDYSFGAREEDAASPPQQFRGPVHCADVSHDGLVYVCDRMTNRVQVFTRGGEYLREAFYAPSTLRSGSTWDLAFSNDPEQRYVYLVDGVNEKVRIIDRTSLEELAAFGAGGRQPGQFFGVHSIATDSRGNIYTGETYEGKRLQKFVNRGMRAVTADSHSSPWPEDR